MGHRHLRRMATTTGRLHLTPSSPSTRPEDPPALETPARRAPPADSSCPDATISPTSRPAPTPSEPNRPREKSRLAGVFLEDSYVLGISESSEQVVFHLDAVLTPEHPAYHSPRLGEQYCYANGNLIFPDVTQIVWLNRNSSHYTDASGEQDLGNIDILTVDGDALSRRVIGAQFGSPAHNRALNSGDDVEPS